MRHLTAMTFALGWVFTWGGAAAAWLLLREAARLRRPVSLVGAFAAALVAIVGGLGIAWLGGVR